MSGLDGFTSSDGRVWMRPEDSASLQLLREEVWRGIRLVLDQGEGGKRYEGRITVGAPGFFDEQWWELGLSLYLPGPSRHYSWDGESLAGCIEQALADVREWIGDVLAEIAEEADS